MTYPSSRVTFLSAKCMDVDFVAIRQSFRNIYDGRIQYRLAAFIALFLLRQFLLEIVDVDPALDDAIVEQ